MPKGMKALPTHWGPKVRHRGGDPGPNKERIKKRKQMRLGGNSEAEVKNKTKKFNDLEYLENPRLDEKIYFILVVVYKFV